MKTRYAVLRAPKYFIARCLFKVIRSCFVYLDVHSFIWWFAFLFHLEFKFEKHSNRAYKGQCDFSSILFIKNFMVTFYGRGSTAERLQSHYEDAVYFLPLSSEKFLVPIWSTSEGWKAESTLEPPGGFEHRTIGLWIQRLKQKTSFVFSLLIFNESEICHNRNNNIANYQEHYWLFRVYRVPRNISRFCFKNCFSCAIFLQIVF